MMRCCLRSYKSSANICAVVNKLRRSAGAAAALNAPAQGVIAVADGHSSREYRNLEAILIVPSISPASARIGFRDHISVRVVAVAVRICRNELIKRLVAITRALL